MRLPLRLSISLGAVLPALALPAIAGAQDYSDLPPLAPVSEAEIRALPPEYRAAPMVSQTAETVTATDGVKTITRTRRISRPRRAAAAQARPHQGAMHHSYAQVAYSPAPVVFEREQWLDECRRRTAGRKKKHRYDCDAALDGYLSQYGAPGARIASREIAYPAYAGGQAYGYGYPVNYGYAYAPPPQIVMVPVRSEVQQQAVVRETVREETYTVPGAARVIPAPAPAPSAKMIKGGR